MGLKPTLPKSEVGVIEDLIGTAYDNVKLVADNLDAINLVASNIIAANADIVLDIEELSSRLDSLSLSLQDSITQAQYDLTQLVTAFNTTISGSLTSTDTTVANLVSSLSDILDRLSNNDLVVVDHETRITSLQTETVTIIDTLTTQANAVDLLDTRVVAVEEGVETSSTKLTLLEATVEGYNSANTTAISTLNSTTTANGNSIAAILDDIVVLRADIESNLQSLNGLGLSINSLTNRVSSSEGNITSIQEDLTTLTGRVADTEQNIIAEGSARSTLSNRVTVTEGNISSIQQDIVELNGSVFSLNQDVNAAVNATNQLVTDLGVTNDLVYSHSQSLIDLDAFITNVDNQNLVHTEAINNLTVFASETENGFTAVANEVTRLDTRIDNVDTTGQALALEGLTTRVEVVEGDVDALSISYTNLNTTVENHTTDIANLVIADSSLGARWEVKSSVNDLVSKVGYYNDGTNTKFVISHNGVDGLIYNIDTNALEVKGRITLTEPSTGFANFTDIPNYVTQTVLNTTVAGLQNQIDGAITSWFYEGAPSLSNNPAINWTTTTQRDAHLGDLYYDKITQYAYRFDLTNSVYSWVRIADTDIATALQAASTAQDTADGKRRTFLVQPSHPYDKGDIWVVNSNTIRVAIENSVPVPDFILADWVDVATLGADWDSNLDGIPDRFTDVPTEGLNLTATHMGYYTAGTWKTYFNNSGHMYLVGDVSNSLSWNGSVLQIRGDIEASSVKANTSLSSPIITTGQLTGGSINITSGLANVKLGTFFDSSVSKNSIFHASYNGDTKLALYEDGTVKLKGALTIESGSTGYGSLTDKPTSLSQINSTESTKLSGIAAGATVGATWGTNLLNIPSTLAAPSSTGLYLSNSNLGFYQSGVWKTYMDNSGNFYLGGVGGKLQWNSATNSLNISGNITIENQGSISIAGFQDSSAYANSNVNLVDLGYIGALNATYGATWKSNIIGQPSDSALMNNLIDTTVWQAGQTGSVGGFDYFTSSANQSRVLAIGPHGSEEVVWKTVYAGSSTFGGALCPAIPVDNTKAYRVSIWVKRIGGAGQSRLRLESPVTNVQTLTNYSWVGALQGISLPLDEWCLMTTIVHSKDTALTTYTGNTAYYLKSTGVKSSSLADYKFQASTTSLRIGFDLTTGVSATEVLYARPRIDLLDGTEPSLETLLGTLNHLSPQTTTGLNLTATHLGYYNGSAWQSYMDSTGKFYLNGNASNYLYWDGSTLQIKGDIDATKITSSIAKIGLNAGLTNQGSQSFAIGDYAGETNQGGLSIALGYRSGQNTQGGNSIAIGWDAARYTQGFASVAVGYAAGQTTQNDLSVAIGYTAGSYNQSYENVAIGNAAGSDTQSSWSVAVGSEAGKTTQGASSVAIGRWAGRSNQGTSSVAVGTNAGTDAQSANSVAIGTNAGKTSQGQYCVAIGNQAGETGQTSNNSVLVGHLTGYGNTTDNRTTGSNTVAVGTNACAGGNSSVSIGTAAGWGTKTGSYSISIGDLSSAAASYSTAIGSDAWVGATHNNSTSIGSSAASTAAYQFTLGDSTITNLRCNDTSISSLSDARDKTDVIACPIGLDYLCQLEPVEFTWKYRKEHYVKDQAPVKEGTKQIGFLAQNLKEVQDAYNISSLNSYQVYSENDTKQGIEIIEADQGKLIPVLVKAIQELKAEIDELKKKI